MPIPEANPSRTYHLSLLAIHLLHNQLSRTDNTKTIQAPWVVLYVRLT